MGKAAMILVVGAFGLVGCTSGAPETVKETVYVPVPVQQQEDPLEEMREQQQVAEQLCEDLGGQVNYSGDCVLPEPEIEEPPFEPAYVEDPCRLHVHRQLNPDECAGYQPDFP